MIESPSLIMQSWFGRISLVLAMMLVAVGLVATDGGATLLAQEIVTFDKSFAPDTIGPGSVSTLRFDIINNDSVNPISDPTFTDILPSGVVIASPANVTATCPGNLIASAGGGVILYFGERLGAGSACSIQLDVTSSTSGTHTNVSGNLTSSAGNHGNASADLTVDPGRPGFVKSFSPDTIPAGGTSTLELTIDNTANESGIDGLSFTDVLPAGMIIANPADASTTCTGGDFPPQLTAVPGTNTISHISGHVDGSASCAIRVDVTTSDTGTFVNTTGELVTGRLETLSSGKASAVLSVPVKFLTKSFTDDPVAPGDTVTLQFTLTNVNRGQEATDITFSDDLDATLTGLAAVGLPVNNVCGAGSQLAGTNLLTLTGAKLPPAGSCSFGVTLQVPALASSGTYTNTTSAVFATVGGEPAEGEPAADRLVIDVAPVLAKAFTDDPVAPGGDATLAFTITNSSAISNVVDIAFDDNLDALIPGTTATLPLDGFCGRGSSITAQEIPQGGDLHLVVSGGNLAPGASCAFTTTLHIPQGIAGGVYPNTTSSVSATMGNTLLAGKPATDYLVVAGAPQLTKSFTDDPVHPGDTVNLEFRLANVENGPASVSDVAFSDDLDAVLPGLQAVGLPIYNVCGAGSQLSGTSNLVFSGGSLGPGKFCTFDVTLQVPAAALSGSYTNTTSEVAAKVLGTDVAGRPARDVLSVAGLTLEKSFSDRPALPGTTTRLEFTIDNSSPVSDVTDIVFSDDVNATLTGMVARGLPASNICGPGSEIAGTDLLSFTGGSLGAGESCTFAVTLEVPMAAQPGEYRNTTSPATASAGGAKTTAEPATDDLVVSQILNFDKSFLDDPVMPGESVTLQFTISNTHPTEGATAVAFTDDLDSALPGLVAVGLPASGVCGAGSQIDGTSLLNFAAGSLGPGASCSFSVTLQVPPDVPAGVSAINTTSPIQGTVGGAQVTGDAATDVLAVNLFNFSKAFDGPTIPDGSPKLSFTIENVDPTDAASRLAFSDDLDAVLPGLVAVGLPADDVCGAGSKLRGTSSLTLVDGSLAPGASCTFDVTLEVPRAAPPGSYINTTTVLLQNGLPVSSPASATLTVEPLHYNFVPLLMRGYTPLEGR